MMTRFDTAIVKPKNEGRQLDRVLGRKRQPIRREDSLDFLSGPRQANRFSSIRSIVTVGAMRQHREIKLLRLATNEVNLVIWEDIEFLLEVDDASLRPCLSAA